MISEKIKNYLLEETRKILTNHEYFHDFKLTRFSRDIPYDYEEFTFYDEETKRERKVRVSCGATKVCLLFDYEDGYNYVVKIPYRRNIDYCAIEFENYNRAVREGLSKYFAEMEYVSELVIVSGETLEECTAMNFPVYIMERVYVDGVEASDRSYNYFREKIYSHENADEDDITDEYWEAIDSEEFTESEFCFKAAYSEEICDKLSTFLYKNNINDIHTQNIGFRDWDRPVFIDYSGYHG